MNWLHDVLNKVSRWISFSTIKEHCLSYVDLEKGTIIMKILLAISTYITSFSRGEKKNIVDYTMSRINMEYHSYNTITERYS